MLGLLIDLNKICAFLRLMLFLILKATSVLLKSIIAVLVGVYLSKITTIL